MDIDDSKNNIKTDKIKKKDRTPKKDYWSIKITFITFLTALILGFFSEFMLTSLNIFIALVILIAIILIGIVCDIIGLAIATADPKPFHSMASNKVKGAGSAIKLIKNAEKATNFFNDVVGDIAGIISGATGAAVGASVVAKILVGENEIKEIFIFSVVSACIAALTVGGKAVGKKIAIKNANSIVFFVGKIISVFDKKKY